MWLLYPRILPSNFVVMTTEGTCLNCPIRKLPNEHFEKFTVNLLKCGVPGVHEENTK